MGAQACSPDKRGSRPISRVLSWTVIPLGIASPQCSSNLPEPSAGHANGFLFGLAPSGVYHATHCCQARGALLPHPFTLTGLERLRRSTLCCTFRRLTPPRGYLALCPMEPGLSSPEVLTPQRRLSGQLRRQAYQRLGLPSIPAFDCLQARIPDLLAPPHQTSRHRCRLFDANAFGKQGIE